MPAALLMANLCAEVRHLVRSGVGASAVAERLNHHFFDADIPGRLITFLLVVADTADDRMTVVNAGHMCPMTRRADGTIEIVGDDEVGVPLGVERNIAYRAATTTLGSGDVMVLFTDGVNEAMDPDDKLLGIEGVSRAIASTQGGPAQVGEAIIRAVRTHAAGRPQSDDIAVVCFSRD